LETVTQLLMQLYIMCKQIHVMAILRYNILLKTTVN